MISGGRTSPGGLTRGRNATPADRIVSGENGLSHRGLDHRRRRPGREPGCENLLIDSFYEEATGAGEGGVFFRDGISVNADDVGDLDSVLDGSWSELDAEFERVVEADIGLAQRQQRIEAERTHARMNAGIRQAFAGRGSPAAGRNPPPRTPSTPLPRPRTRSPSGARRRRWADRCRTTPDRPWRARGCSGDLPVVKVRVLRMECVEQDLDGGAAGGGMHRTSSRGAAACSSTPL